MRFTVFGNFVILQPTYYSYHLYMEKRKILITGASKGLGLAIAKKLSPAYELILHASKKESFTSFEPGCHILCADFTDAEQLTAFCRQLKKEHGESLYGVINNAGLTYDKPLNFQPEREIDAMLNVNLRAPILICKTAMKIFGLLNRGVIINISSVVGESGNAFQSVYAATKAGLTALSRSLAQEAAELNDSHNIRVLSVSPGFIETDMTAGIPGKIREKYLNMIPAKRFGNVNDVADTIAFLLSDQASYINGTNIHINGGLI
jgi:3-oxoacyl-[acyl-carrier protein] reductase